VRISTESSVYHSYSNPVYNDPYELIQTAISDPAMTQPGNRGSFASDVSGISYTCNNLQKPLHTTCWWLQSSRTLTILAVIFFRFLVNLNPLFIGVSFLCVRVLYVYVYTSIWIWWLLKSHETDFSLEDKQWGKE